ncbi:MAG: tetratricopeptide repeat protein [Elusimicrobia bacterium]|nr:tetratricopeptide repeat protein [Elusimicrobiota bacterium]
MRKTVKLALITIVLTGGTLAAQQQFVSPEPGKEAFYKFYNQAINAHMTSKFRDAEASYYAAMTEAVKLPGATWEYGRSSVLFATAYHIHGYLPEAERFYRESLDYNCKNNPEGCFMGISGLGRLYLQQNKLGKAGPFLEQGLILSRREEENVEEKYSTADALSALAEFNEKKGNLKNAEIFYNKAVAIFHNKETAFPFQVLDAELMDSYPIILYKTGEFYRRQGNIKAANNFYTRALRAWTNWTELDSRPALKARVLDYKGRTLKALGDRSEAAENISSALRLYKTLYRAKDYRIVEAGAQSAALKK